MSSREHHRAFARLAGLLVLSAIFSGESVAFAQATAPSRVVGTVQSISGATLTVLSDAGATSSVSIEDSTKLFQIEPGKTDLKEATPFALSDLQPGDRVLVRGALAEDGKTLRAASLIAMKKAAISEKQSKDRAEWQHGVGGLVKSVDLAAQTILLTTNGGSSGKELVLRISKETILRRYAPDSTRFDSAKPAPLSEIKAGDQLRARGSRGSDPAGFDPVEIVSGSFRNISGTISSVDAASNTVVVQDVALKAAITMRISAESQMRKLSAPLAERLAIRLKGQGSDVSGGTPSAQAANAPAAQTAQPPSSPQGAGGTAGGAASARGGDIQQMIARLPATALSDLQKGDAVMIVATQGSEKSPSTVVTLLAGVDPILRASPKGGQDMILSPWSLGGGEPSVN